jgi:hypothetical protein
MEICVFKKGYRPPSASSQLLSQMLAPQAGLIGIDLVLGQESSSVVERLDTMKAYLPGCNRDGMSNRDLVSYDRDVQEEIEALLATKDGQAIKKREEAAQAAPLRTKNPRPYEQITLLSLIDRINDLEDARQSIQLPLLAGKDQSMTERPQVPSRKIAKYRAIVWTPQSNPSPQPAAGSFHNHNRTRVVVFVRVRWPLRVDRQEPNGLGRIDSSDSVATVKAKQGIGRHRLQQCDSFCDGHDSSLIRWMSWARLSSRHHPWAS